MSNTLMSQSVALSTVTVTRRLSRVVSPCVYLTLSDVAHCCVFWRHCQGGISRGDVSWSLELRIPPLEFTLCPRVGWLTSPHWYW